MRLAYLDSSALVKRVADEPNAGAVRHLIHTALTDGHTLTTNDLGVVETTRVLRRLVPDTTAAGEAADVCLSGIGVLAIAADAWALAARGLVPVGLRTLDAVHIASAVTVGADLFITTDKAQAQAARAARLTVREA